MGAAGNGMKKVIQLNTLESTLFIIAIINSGFQLKYFKSSLLLINNNLDKKLFIAPFTI